MTVTTDAEQARLLRAELAHRVTAPESPWREAVTAVPRHCFVPCFHERVAQRWRTVAHGHPDYLAGVYADRTLTLGLVDGVPAATSGEPGRTVAVLEALDVRDGHRVLEVGTGTGYAAALLTHRLGDAQVTTVDGDPHVTVPAAERLAAAGYRPSVRTGDGALGVPDRAPYDRIAVTYAMRSVPWPWVEQAAEGGVLVVPVGGGLARLTVGDGGAEGRFLAAGPSLLPCRADPVPPRFGELDLVEPRRPRTPLSVVEAFDRLEFPLSLALPGHGRRVWTEGDGRTVREVGLWTADGSVARVHVDGTVRQLGPRRLWNVVEEVDEVLPRAGREGAVYGLTVEPGRQRVWYGDPTGPGWELPPASVAA